MNNQIHSYSFLTLKVLIWECICRSNWAYFQSLFISSGILALPSAPQAPRQHFHPNLISKRTEDGSRSKDEHRDGEKTEAVCKDVGNEHVTGSWFGFEKPAWGQRPEQWEESIGTYSRRHHHRSPVLCPPPTTCRQGTCCMCVYVFPSMYMW